LDLVAGLAFGALAAGAVRGGEALSAAGRAARFSLRRCGRVRGSELSRSGGRSSLIVGQSSQGIDGGSAKNRSQDETVLSVLG
jgi:hypothetical protein